MVNTEGLPKAQVLAALYNHAKPLGMGFLHYTPEKMTEAKAQKLLDETPDKYFDYVGGRVMKVGLRNDAGFEESLYDRDNGHGKAADVIRDLRENGL